MSANFENSIDSEKPVLIDFFASWCGLCKTLAPILKQVNDNLGKSITILKIECRQKSTIGFKISSSSRSGPGFVSKRKTIVAGHSPI
jgi:thioredoxin 1